MSYKPALIALVLTACGGLTSSVPSADDYLNADSGGDIALVGDLAVNPATVDFGYVEPEFSQSEVLKLTNVGDYLITLADFSVVGEGVFEITTVSLDSNAIDAADEVTLSNGESIEVVVTFTPTESRDSWSGAISFVTDISGSEYVEVPILGSSTVSDTLTDTGGTSGTVDGTLIATPSSIEFPETDIGHDSDPIPVEFTNDTTSNVAIINVEFTDTVWGWNNDFNLPWIMEPGETVTASFIYTPTAETIDYGTATVVTDNASVFGTVSLTGTGADLCDICAPQIYVSAGYVIDDFFSLLGFPDQRNVIIQNTGDEPLEISDISVTNDPQGGEFTISGWNAAASPVVIDPYQSFSFDISYTATSIALDFPNTAADQNILHILSNDPSSPDWTIQLSGFGLAMN
jgi:hypothetical protein